MDPFQVRFRQKSIANRFREGRTIEELAEELRSGGINPEDVPPLRLVEINGVYFTLDNRRLEAFRRAGVAIPWRMAAPEEVAAEAWKFTTDNDGKSVQFEDEHHEPKWRPEACGSQ